MNMKGIESRFKILIHKLKYFFSFDMLEWST